MDQSFMIMLTNLLHLQNSLDPTSALTLSDTSSSSSSAAATASSSAAAPLLFFTIASVLSFAASKKPTSNKPSKPSSSSSAAAAAAGDYSVAAFQALSTEHIWSLEAPLRDAQWRSMYGLSYPVFTTVVDKLKPHIALSNLSLPSDYAVAMVLSRLCLGLSAKAVAARYSLEPYLVSKITNMVTRLLATKLYPEFIKIPVGRRRLVDTTRAFDELTSLPNMCGAIDSSPVRLRNIPSSSSSSVNYKCRYGYEAVLVQVVADQKRIFWDVCVKAGGGTEDAAHLRDSLLYSRLTSGDVVWDRMVNVRGDMVRPYIVGDWCYPLLPFLLTPFSRGGSGTPSQNLFDGMLMRGRAAAVDAIGLLKGRWRILRDLNVGLNHAPQTVVACCVLHNLCQVAKEPEPELWKDPDERGPPARATEVEKPLCFYGENVRRLLADDLHHRLSAR